MAERRYKHPQVNLRLPEELKERIASLAAAHGRSANAEMVDAIESWVAFHDGIDVNARQLTKPLKEPVAIKKEEMMHLLQSIQEAVVSQLVNKYNFIPKDNEEDADNK